MLSLSATVTNQLVASPFIHFVNHVLCGQALAGFGQPKTKTIRICQYDLLSVCLLMHLTSHALRGQVGVSWSKAAEVREHGNQV